MPIELGSDGIVIDASLLGGLLGVDPAAIHTLLKTREITSFCERGIDEHEGEYRLSFFYGNRRARVHVDAKGNVRKRSAIDFGESALPHILRRAGG